MKILHKSVTVKVRYLLSFWKAMLSCSIFLRQPENTAKTKQRRKALSALWRQRFLFQKKVIYLSFEIKKFHQKEKQSAERSED